MLDTIVEELFIKIYEETWIENAWFDKTSVVLSPRSMSSTIVPKVPFGPSPFKMNWEVIRGMGSPLLMAVAVESGLGVISFASLLF